MLTDIHLDCSCMHKAGFLQDAVKISLRVWGSKLSACQPVGIG